MTKKSKCKCGINPKLIFSCSGAADVGSITDSVARELTFEGVGNMFCLAGIGGRVSGIMKSTQKAEKILVIDGCPMACAKNCLTKAGFKDFEYINLADMGMKKGETEPNNCNISKIITKAKEKLS